MYSIVRIGAGLALVISAIVVLDTGFVFAQSPKLPTIVAPSPSVGGPSTPRRAPSLTQPGQPVISEIIIQGTQRIEPETVRSYMLVKEGDSFDPTGINDTLKGLFATGLFADVIMTREGDTLVVRVTENPIINRIAFEGNSRIEQATLRSEVQLRPRIVYTRTRVQNDVKRLLDLYRRSGRFAATVEPKVIQLPQNRVDLVFEIDEGPVTGIRRISFIGNREFSDRALRDVVQTTESRWYKFLSTDDTYDPDRLTFDRELLRRHYLKNGYADFRVVSAVAELTADGKDFFITFTIEEGKRYKYEKVNVTSKITEVDVNQLKEDVDFEPGDWYNSEDVDKTVAGISNKVGDLGFAFVEVRPQVKRDRKKSTIDITFEVLEGARVYIERIDVVGNVRTLDKVIRREFNLVEGDAFSSSKLRSSRTRIQNLGYFSRVDIVNTPGSTPDKTVIKAEVAEKSTGELSLGAGFSSSSGALFDIKLRERNLLGRGQDLRASLVLAAKSQDIDFSFTEPYFLDKELSAGIDLFRTRSQTISEFDRTSTGGGFRLGYRLTENLSHRVRYTLRQDEISDIDSGASQFIRREEGEKLVSLIGQDLTYDTRNSRIDPTGGYVLRLSNDIAGLGGDLGYLKTTLTGAIYHQFFEGWVGSVRGQIGNVFGFGDDDVRISDRFFLGGDRLRGFQNSGVGPRDLSTDDALGGKQSYSATAELQFPLGLPKHLGVSGALFSDVGTLTELDFDSPLIADTGSIRFGVGFGVAWQSPFGPIRVDFALPVVKEDFDQTENVRFNFGTRF